VSVSDERAGAGEERPGAPAEGAPTAGPAGTADEPVVAAGAGAGAAEAQPSEDELRAAYAAEMSRISSTDMILQAAVSLLNIGGYRLGLSSPQNQPAGGVRDLEQVRDAIDGARALLPILERRVHAEMRPLRDALSQLQMAYAREAGATGVPADRAGAQGGQNAPAAKPDVPGTAAASAAQKPEGPGPAVSSGRLWVPGR
jgi:hypothetical protein